MNRDIHYSYYLVAFIDVLGQKDAFQGIDSLPKDGDNNLKEKLYEAHKQTVIFVEEFRERFRDIFNIYAEERESELEVAEADKEQFDEMRKVELNHQRFSDCIQAHVSLQTEKYHVVAVNGVFGVLVACGAMLLFSLAMKKSFRAGIDVGIGTRLNNGEIYGPALFRAYTLESKIAQYPRIVVGDELINYLKNLSAREVQIPDQNNKDIELCKRMADKCINMIVKDMDSCPVLDYLGDEFRRIYDKFPQDDREMSYEYIFNKAFEFVESEYIKRREMEDRKLALRYYLLHQYFRARKSKN